MKNIIFGGVLCIAMLFFSTSVYADDVTLDIGVKGWYNQFKIKSDDPAAGEGKSDYNFLVGPTVKVAYKKFFLGATFMQAVNDYEFEFSEHEWSRKDLDIVLGYMLHPRVALFAGYKYLTGTSNFDEEHTVDGPAFGIYRLHFAKIRTTIYANGAYMPLKGEYIYAGERQGYDVNSYSVEGGIAVSLHKNWLVNVGYKYQDLYWRRAAHDITSGVTFGLSYVTD